ncbi:MAG: peptidylprolyl isomerase [Sulfurospirillum sp.]|nr:peptidylprolyl isomerase [Sulfurospirillum sp.]
MITWMQRNKKYLVVTIWISTIAFVGAGFVGWGAYDFNTDRASAIAKVGDRKVSVQELQYAYSNYYNFYNNMLGGNLTQEKAEAMGLEKMVIKSLVDEATMLSYADEIGLSVLDSEIKTKIANDENFQENGSFNKDIYYAALKRAGFAPKDYEKNLKKQILLEKLQNAFKIIPTKAELELFKSAILMQDRLEVATLDILQEELQFSQEELKKFWDERKDNYKTIKSYTLDILNVPALSKQVDAKELLAYFEENKNNYTDSDGKLLSFEVAKEDAKRDLLLKLTKKSALEAYLEFKKDTAVATETKEIFANDITFPIEKLQEGTSGETLKPFVYNDNYIVVKIKAINEPQTQSFEQAKAQVQNEFLAEKRTTALEMKAKNTLPDFKGKDIGFVSRDNIIKILEFDEAKSSQIINSIFDKQEKSGYEIIDDQVVLYRILEQNLLPSVKAEQYTSLINDNIMQAKRSDFNINLIKKLSSRYDSELYYKGK